MAKTKTHNEWAEEGLEGLRRSQAFAKERASETKTPFVLWKKGKVVELTPEPTSSPGAEAEKPQELTRVREERED